MWRLPSALWCRLGADPSQLDILSCDVALALHVSAAHVVPISNTREAMIRRMALLAGLVWSTGVGDLAAQVQQAQLGGGGTLAAPRDLLSAPAILLNRSTIPGVVEVTLTAAPARLALLPGTPTDVYAYNGSIPGPTLEVHEGDRV